MKPSDCLSAHRDRVIEILNRRKLQYPRLFGSVARRDDDDLSDLDVLVEAPPGTSLFDLAAAELGIEELLGCRTAILTDGFLAPNVRQCVMVDLVTLQ